MKEVIKDLDDIVAKIEHIKQYLSEYNKIEDSDNLEDLDGVEEELEELLKSAGINFTKIKIVQKGDE